MNFWREAVDPKVQEKATFWEIIRESFPFTGSRHLHALKPESRSAPETFKTDLENLETAL